MKASIVNLNPIRVKTVNPFLDKPFQRSVHQTMIDLENFQQAESNRKEYSIAEDEEVDYEKIVRSRIEEMAGEKMTDGEWKILCKEKGNDDLFLVMRKAVQQAKTLYPFSLEDMQKFAVAIRKRCMHYNDDSLQFKKWSDVFIKSLHPPHKIGDIVNIEIISEESLTAKIIDP